MVQISAQDNIETLLRYFNMFSAEGCPFCALQWQRSDISGRKQIFSDYFFTFPLHDISCRGLARPLLHHVVNPSRTCAHLSTDYMVRPRWDRMYRSHQAIRKSLTLRLTEVRPFSRSVCTPLFYVKCRCNITSQVIEQFYQDLRDTELIYLLHSPNCSMAGRPTSCRHWFTCDASKSGARFPLPSI